MVFLNAIALDLIPYAQRALFQIQGRSSFLEVFSGLLLSLLVYDFCEIYHLGGKANVTGLTTTTSDKVEKLKDDDKLSKPAAVNDMDSSQIIPLSAIENPPRQTI